ncbi:hypothetical protein [Shewanella surugensis]|uniref:Uncharacterized protein n=1 Tax=Shewanella surugensis TaxID=212020 RepID=A0ABT0L744_9GAMM|nr:hypothetical protein [Shewanella surugensis]MCL1122976.1 hypothetical protein [Shewanella surugensis]
MAGLIVLKPKPKPSTKLPHSLPKKMPKPLFTELVNGQTQVKVVHKGETLLEITAKGSHALLTTQAKLLYQSLIDTEVE